MKKTISNDLSIDNEMSNTNKFESKNIESNSNKKNLKLSLDSNYSEKNIKNKNNERTLRFDKIKDITYWLFLRESIFYIISILSQKLIAVIIHIMYGIYNHQDLIGKVALTINTLNLLSSGIRDLRMPLNIICSPYYSKKDYQQYRLNRNKLAMLNIVLYCLFLNVYFAIEPLYNLLGVYSENMSDILLLSKLFIFVYGPLMALSNFLKGKNN